MKSAQYRSLAFVLVLLLALVGCQEDVTTLDAAGYNPEDDVYIMIGGQVIEDATSVLPVDLIGELAFELQEGTHENITDASGAEIDYYYIWVCLADACIPVDPFRVSS